VPDRPASTTLALLDPARVIREARTLAGLTQTELADRLSTKQSVVSRWERGLDVPRVDTLARILDACGLEADVRFRRHDDVDRSQVARLARLEPRERVRHFQSAIDAYREARNATRVS
jgi:transcriptional regulator with XRE-family HTH domain